MYLCNRPPCTLHTFGQSPFALGSTFFFPPPKSGLSCSNLACLLTRACWSNTQNSPILILEVHFSLLIPRKCAFLKKLRGSLALCWAGLNYPALDKLRGFTRLQRLEWKLAKLRNSFAAKRLGLYQHQHHQHALNAIKIGVQNDQCVFTFYDDNCFEYFCCLDFNSTQFWLQNVCYFTQLKEILASWVLRRRQLVLCGDNQESISCAAGDGCLHFHTQSSPRNFTNFSHWIFANL